ncbi:uncharacterized protein LOC111316690 [Durio zibethinus]|uniref:Uncharacterized protein LOC111316690 n=1 Tax=Durio zibethinus TaxID=66656 RepID=A0A6P6BBK9_DURZI|nr:uncharacterized protein LOC111316690 [Durio zibethinus]
MIDSTLDLISQAVSNNLYVFCLFNLIIVMILMGSKHGSSLDQDFEIPLSAPTYDKQSISVSEQVKNANRLWSAYETAKDDNKGNRNGFDANNTEDADEDDDELRRRVEEFIAKVNREWRAEKLGLSFSA